MVLRSLILSILKVGQGMVLLTNLRSVIFSLFEFFLDTVNSDVLLSRCIKGPEPVVGRLQCTSEPERSLLVPLGEIFLLD